jgi:hypothetical protein
LGRDWELVSFVVSVGRCDCTDGMGWDGVDARKGWSLCAIDRCRYYIEGRISLPNTLLLTTLL